MTTDDRKTELEDLLNLGTAAVADTETELKQRPTRREMVRIAVIVGVVCACIASGISIMVASAALSHTAATAAEQRAQAKDAESNRQLAQQAYDAARAANDTLAARGQPQVPIPSPASGDPSETLIAAATARVMASLPDLHPTTTQLGQAVAAYMLANPAPGPTAGQVAQGVADYLARNPLPAGPPGPAGPAGSDGRPGTDGKDGVPGPPPTQQQIQDAFVAYVNEHPDFLPTQLCANYGQNFSQAKDLVAQDGTKYTLYGCITEVVPATPPVTPTS